MRLPQRPVLPEGRIDREHRHPAVVKTVIGQFPAVRRPPEGAVLRGPPEDFLVIDPGGIAVQDHGGTVEGQAGFRGRGDVHDIQVVRPGEGEHRRVRGPGQVDRPLRLHRESGILLLEPAALRHLRKPGNGIVPFSVREIQAVVIQPFPFGRIHCQVLCGKGRRQQQREEEKLFHTNNPSLKFTRYTCSTARVSAV